MVKGTKRNFLKSRPAARSPNIMSCLLSFFVIEIAVLTINPSGKTNIDNLGGGLY
jgi:hypothetical protein